MTPPSSRPSTSKIAARSNSPSPSRLRAAIGTPSMPAVAGEGVTAISQSSATIKIERWHPRVGTKTTVPAHGSVERI